MKIYELKKDISTPSIYMQAGIRKTEEEWEAAFPDSFAFCANSEWFIDVTTPMDEHQQHTMELEIVNSVFTKRGLKSLSYKEAAHECLKQYKTMLEKSNV